MKHGNIFLFDLIYYGNKNKKKFLLPPLFAILSYYVMAVVCKKNQILDLCDLSLLFVFPSDPHSLRHDARKSNCRSFLA